MKFSDVCLIGVVLLLAVIVFDFRPTWDYIVWVGIVGIISFAFGH